MARKKAEKKSQPAASAPDTARAAFATTEGLHRTVITEEDFVSRREKIALLAYSYWQQRGCPHGSADEDWFRAEQDVDRVST